MFVTSSLFGEGGGACVIKWMLEDTKSILLWKSLLRRQSDVSSCERTCCFVVDTQAGLERETDKNNVR